MVTFDLGVVDIYRSQDCCSLIYTQFGLGSRRRVQSRRRQNGTKTITGVKDRSVYYLDSVEIEGEDIAGGRRSGQLRRRLHRHRTGTGKGGKGDETSSTVTENETNNDSTGQERRSKTQGDR